MNTDTPKKNSYNPKKHHRKSRRLKEYDYSTSGLYFITLVYEKRIHRFGQIKNGKMKLNECGQIAFDKWVKLPERFPKFKMNVFQIMPDHFHSIIELFGSKEAASLTAAQIGTCLGRWCKSDSSAIATLVEVTSIGTCVGRWYKGHSSVSTNLTAQKTRVLQTL